jgi:hypothetical protein
MKRWLETRPLIHNDNRERGRKRKKRQPGNEESLRKTMLDMVSALCTFSAPSSFLYVSKVNGVYNKN